MKLRTRRMVLTLLGLTLWSCVWATAAMSYPIKEAPIAASGRQVYWLDKSHIVFHGFTGGKGSPGQESPLSNRGAYVWDLDRGTATREPRFDHAANICSRQPYLSYTVPSKDNKTTRRVAFENGQEIELSKKLWFNPKSCRVHRTKPSWEVEGRNTVPLLEEHGYIDRGNKGEDQIEEFPLQYYRSGAAEPIPLALDSRHVSQRVRFAPFLDAYVLESASGRLTAKPLWLLHPSGTVEQIFSPEGKPWAEQQWSWVEVTKRGLAFGKITYGGDHIKDSGLYVWEQETLTQVENAVLTWPSISPDGCRLAVIKFSPERALATAELHTLQVIDLCNGGSDVH
jgi:hypothetical protein